MTAKVTPASKVSPLHGASETNTYVCVCVYIHTSRPNVFANTGYQVRYTYSDISMVSCQKGPTRHAYAWQIGPFWQDTLDIAIISTVVFGFEVLRAADLQVWNHISKTLHKHKR